MVSPDIQKQTYIFEFNVEISLWVSGVYGINRLFFVVHIAVCGIRHQRILLSRVAKLAVFARKDCHSMGKISVFLWNCKAWLCSQAIEF